MSEASPVMCPECRDEFLVPTQATEALCPGCDSHIVWRRCLVSGEAFPVLTRWRTWVHPDCTEVHQVDLRVAVAARVVALAAGSGAQPESQPPTDHPREETSVLCDAVWAAGGIAGRLYLDDANVGLWPMGESPVVLGALADVHSATITTSAEPGGAHRSRWRRTRSTLLSRPVDGCSLVLQLPDAIVKLHAATDADALRAAVGSRLPVS